jgi:23S rRNA (uracil1939-C5)-methyltransferase
VDGDAGAVNPSRLDQVESLDLQGRGVVRGDGKIAFVEGALPGERVRWECARSGRSFDTGRVIEIQRASSLRVQPRCPHFGLQRGACGGCSMQHLDGRGQVSIKQRVLEDALWHLGRLRPDQVLRPIGGVLWGYRHRARLSVRFVARKGEALVGFHERASSFVADIKECRILAGPVSSLLVPLRALVTGLVLRKRLPQIEVAVVQAGGRVHTVLVFRILDALPQSDRDALARFGELHRVAIWIQPGGPATAAPLGPADAMDLVLELPEFGLAVPFAPTDFTQVNHAVNEILVRRALALLGAQPHERALDLFCGLGNFTLPLATQAGQVIGIEGNGAQVARATANAHSNGLQSRARFLVQDLSGWTREEWETLSRRDGPFDRILVDPPREGALAVARALADSPLRPQRVVYVSCNPATLARDCAVLVHEGRWRLASAGVVNMFPHTSHVESMAVLEPDRG